MSKWRYVVSRANMASTRVEFKCISDALAFIYGSEYMNPGYSPEYVIRKIEKGDKEETNDG